MESLEGGELKETHQRRMLVAEKAWEWESSD